MTAPLRTPRPAPPLAPRPPARVRPGRLRGAMEPRAVADAVEAGPEDAALGALRAYNREVSGGGRGGEGRWAAAGRGEAARRRGTDGP